MHTAAVICCQGDIDHHEAEHTETSSSTLGDTGACGADMTLSDSATLAEAKRRPPRRTAGRGALPPPLRLGATSSNCMPGLKTSTAADEPPVADEAADRGIATLYESLLAQLKSASLLPDTFVAMASTKSRLIKRMCIVKRRVQQCCALPPPYETLRVTRRRLTRSRAARATLCLRLPLLKWTLRCAHAPLTAAVCPVRRLSAASGWVLTRC